jgi:1-acyl-sn-glycerol-3-phosphate acyltransferase
MKQLLSYLLTPIHLLAFSLVLLVCHPIQWLALKLGGYAWHKRSVDLLNWGLLRSTWCLGSHARFVGGERLPTDRPLLIVANHQSMHDIPGLSWFFRRHHPKFVSKIELGRGIPSVSFNLRHGGSVLIKRENPRQALPAMQEFARYIEANHYAAVLFPEGTRSRNGEPQPFMTHGLKIMLKYMPSALVVPVTINHTWRIQLGFPMQVGTRPTWTQHPPIEPQGRSADDVIAEIEATVKGGIEQSAWASEAAS